MNIGDILGASLLFMGAALCGYIVITEIYEYFSYRKEFRIGRFAWHFIPVFVFGLASAILVRMGWFLLFGK